MSDQDILAKAVVPEFQWAARMAARHDTDSLHFREVLHQAMGRYLRNVQGLPSANKFISILEDLNRGDLSCFNADERFCEIVRNTGNTHQIQIAQFAAQVVMAGIMSERITGNRIREELFLQYCRFILRREFFDKIRPKMVKDFVTGIEQIAWEEQLMASAAPILTECAAQLQGADDGSGIVIPPVHRNTTVPTPQAMYSEVPIMDDEDMAVFGVDS